MESIFCFEIAIDLLKLRKKIECNVPLISVVFLNFPSIVIKLNKVQHDKSNEYSFKNGKSCLFKISPTELYNQLTITPIYIFVFDQKQNSDAFTNNQQTCIGTTSLDLTYAIKKVIEGLQNFGLSQASFYGDSVCIPLLNNLQDVVGYIEGAFKLTCLGQTIMPHLPTFQNNDCFQDLSNNKCHKLFADSLPKAEFCSLNNVDCPPALYFKSHQTKNKLDDKSINDLEVKTSLIPDKNEPQRNQSIIPEEVENKRKSIVIEWKNQMKKFIQVKPTAGQKTESTQTDLEHLNQYPLLKALINEVVELGLTKPSLSCQQPQFKHLTESRSLPHPKQKIISSHTKVARPPKPLFEKNYLEKKTSVLKVPSKKKYSMSYGLTKTHILRLSLNKHTHLSATYTKPTDNLKTKQSKKVKRSPVKKKSHQSISVFTQTMPDSIKEPDLFSQSFSSENASTELRFGSVKDAEELSFSPDKSSPRVTSRQSIEIHMPSALTENSFHLEDLSSSYKYSDDFDEDQMSVSGHSSSSATLSTQQNSFDLTTSGDKTQHELSKKSSNNVSSQTTKSNQSQISAGIAKNTISQERILRSAATNLSNDEINTVESLSTNFSEMSVDHESEHQMKSTSKFSLNDDSDSKSTDDSKPTDDSLASILTTLHTSKKLPIPAPSSDSPVICSLISEPRRKPRPPTMSQSSSIEHLHRKFKQSSETSFQVSDLSDVRSSELVDIKTSELDDLKSTDENISPMHSFDVLSPNVSFPNVKK